MAKLRLREQWRSRMHRSIVAAFVVAITVTAVPADDDEFIHLANQGKALVENRESARALEILNRALAMRPTAVTVRRNRIRALILSGKFDEALADASKVREQSPQDPAAYYLGGVASVRAEKFQDAVNLFREASQLDSQTPAVRFQLALALQAERKNDEARREYAETVRLDPNHSGAWFKLATLARQAGDQAEFQRCNKEFLRLRREQGDQQRTTETWESCAYTLAESPEVTRPDDSQHAATQPARSIRFVDGQSQLWKELRTCRAIAVLNVGEDGLQTFVVIDSDGQVVVTHKGDSTPFERVQAAGDVRVPAGGNVRLIVGDYFDEVPRGEKYDARVHALNDVLALSGKTCRLLQQATRGVFADVTARAGLAKAEMSDAVWVDADHDGDLDLLAATSKGPALWQNNGDGTFKEITSELKLPTMGAVSAIAAFDMDANVAVDFISALGSGSTRLIENRRAGKFALLPEPAKPWPPAEHVLPEDLDHDGAGDLALISPDAVNLVLSKAGASQQIMLDGFHASAATLVDFDNDGWVDLAVAGRSDAKGPGIRLIRNHDGRTWSDAGDGVSVSDSARGPFEQILAVDLDADGDSDIVLTRSGGGLTALLNEGGSENRQLKIRLVSQKTNASGYGTHVEVRSGRFMTTRAVSSPVIEIGIGQAALVDAVQTVWTNGVVDNQVRVSPGPVPLEIIEKNVATGSCPFLYAFDGRDYRFVTDLLGNSPIGLPLSRGRMLPADPEELVVIGGEERLKARNGQFELQVTSEFREVLYLEQAMLLSMDHEPDIEIHVTDKLMPPPFPPSEVWPLGEPNRLIAAKGDDGVDRLKALAELDGTFAPVGEHLPPPIRGMCRPLGITLEFERDIPKTEPVLALTGWLQYGDGSTNINLSQNSSIENIPPRLDYLTPAGDWKPVDVVVGMPAGKTKTILVDLYGKLPPGVKKLRLTTTYEIHWDRICAFTRKRFQSASFHYLVPASATLRWRGFSELSARGEGQPTTPDYSRVSQAPPWRTTLEGFCTAYGDVLPLVESRDDRVAILNSGDALQLTFDAGKLPPVSDGKQRTYIFYAYGWDKDGDHNVDGGDKVAPGPDLASPGSKRALMFGPNGSFIPGPPSVNMDDPPDDMTDVDEIYHTRWVPRDRFKDGGQSEKPTSTAN